MLVKYPSSVLLVLHSQFAVSRRRITRVTIKQLTNKSHHSEASTTAFRSKGYSCMDIIKTCKYTQTPGRRSALEKQHTNNIVVTEW